MSYLDCLDLSHSAAVADVQAAQEVTLHLQAVEGDSCRTVLKGTFTVAHDGRPDKTALAAGGFLYMPAKMIHEAWTATYFITVDGKWDVNFVE